MTLHPLFTASRPSADDGWPAPCAPIVTQGPVLAAVRSALDEIACGFSERLAGEV